MHSGGFSPFHHDRTVSPMPTTTTNAVCVHWYPKGRKGNNQSLALAPVIGFHSIGSCSYASKPPSYRSLHVPSVYEMPCAQFPKPGLPHLIVHFGEGRGRGERERRGVAGHAVLAQPWRV